MDEINVSDPDEITLEEGEVFFPASTEPAVRLSAEIYYVSLPADSM